MTTDQSAGWEAVSDQFVAIRSQVGAALVRSWAKDRLPRSTAILEIGCGSGVPIARSLVNEGFSSMRRRCIAFVDFGIPDKLSRLARCLRTCSEQFLLRQNIRRRYLDRAYLSA